MDLDFLIFPAPKPSYSEKTLEGELIYIPKVSKNQKNYSNMQDQNQKSTIELKKHHRPNSHHFFNSKDQNFKSDQNLAKYKQNFDSLYLNNKQQYKQFKQNNHFQSQNLNKNNLLANFFNDNKKSNMLNNQNLNLNNSPQKVPQKPGKAFQPQINDSFNNKPSTRIDFTEKPIPQDSFQKLGQIKSKSNLNQNSYSLQTYIGSNDSLPEKKRHQDSLSEINNQNDLQNKQQQEQFQDKNKFLQSKNNFVRSSTLITKKSNLINQNNQCQNSYVNNQSFEKCINQDNQEQKLYKIESIKQQKSSKQYFNQDDEIIDIQKHNSSKNKYKNSNNSSLNNSSSTNVTYPDNSKINNLANYNQKKVKKNSQNAIICEINENDTINDNLNNTQKIKLVNQQKYSPNQSYIPNKQLNFEDEELSCTKQPNKQFFQELKNKSPKKIHFSYQDKIHEKFKQNQLFQKINEAYNNAQKKQKETIQNNQQKNYQQTPLKKKNSLRINPFNEEKLSQKYIEQQLLQVPETNQSLFLDTEEFKTPINIKKGSGNKQELPNSLQEYKTRNFQIYNSFKNKNFPFQISQKELQNRIKQKQMEINQNQNQNSSMHHSTYTNYNNQDVGQQQITTQRSNLYGFRLIKNQCNGDNTFRNQSNQAQNTYLDYQNQLSFSSGYQQYKNNCNFNKKEKQNLEEIFFEVNKQDSQNDSSVFYNKPYEVDQFINNDKQNQSESQNSNNNSPQNFTNRIQQNYQHINCITQYKNQVKKNFQKQNLLKTNQKDEGQNKNIHPNQEQQILHDKPIFNSYDQAKIQEQNIQNNIKFNNNRNKFNNNEQYNQMLYSQQYENKNLKPNQNESIPCLYLKSPIKSNLLGLYFHGNGEDIYLSYHLLNQIRNDLKINVLAMEYSGYGIYKGNSSEQQIIDDAQEIMKYLTINLNIDTQNIIIIGRSIGTGIATLLASQYEFMALFLISPFTSLRAVVKHIAGGIAQYFIKDRFKNIEYISKVQCPIYIAHGKKDKMIPYSHSLELKEQCPNAQKCKVDLPNNMTHVEIDFQRDLIQPFKSFLNQHSFLFKCRIDYSHQKSSGTNIEFPQEVYYNL